MMGKVLYAKGQLKKAYVSWLRRYWRTRKEKTKKENLVLFFFQNCGIMYTQHLKSSI